MADYEDFSIFHSANTTAPFHEFLGSIPGFSLIQDYIFEWVTIDIKLFAAALTILGTLSGTFQYLQTLPIQFSWYITRFFTASVSIKAQDRLNREVVNWISAKVLARQDVRIVTARSDAFDSDVFNYEQADPQDAPRNMQRTPIQYLIAFQSTWFLHQGNLFVVRRVTGGESSTMRPMRKANSDPESMMYVSAPLGQDPLVIMCLGRSVKPIKRFLETCRDFAEEQRNPDDYVTVRISFEGYSRDWDTTICRAIRPLETIHFDESVKAELVADINNYLDPATRRFYTERGIPYRRGYLLHGPAGTGKTSLSLALAGLFGLELYLLHVPSVPDDASLEKLFAKLPPQCFVLLEDIDAVGITKRRGGPKFNGDASADEDTDDDDEGDCGQVSHPASSWQSLNRPPHGLRARITLSGLLNVLDGISSQEGRIVLMTSNFAERLDDALIRPGRIDKMIFLGYISPKSAGLMFKRMYAADSAPPGATARLDTTEEMKVVSAEELEELSHAFGSKIIHDIITPAKLQGYLLQYRNNPRAAVEGVEEWVATKFAEWEEAARRAKQAAHVRRMRRKAEYTFAMPTHDRVANRQRGWGQALRGWFKSDGQDALEDHPALHDSGKVHKTVWF